MKRIQILALIGLITFSGIIEEAAMAENQASKEIRTYMSYGLPLDPAHIFTLEDLDFSYALASTLVDWNDAKEPVSGLASSWEYIGDKKVVFHIGKSAMWSDGSTVNANDVVQSLSRAKRVHGENLKPLFDIIDKIEPSGSSTVLFRLTVNARTSGLIKKLTEPMYGIVKVVDGDRLDLSKTTGPFFLSSSSEKELRFQKNLRWYKASGEMAEAVLVRNSSRMMGAAEFLSDSWPNLMTSNSLEPRSVSAQLKEAHVGSWSRNLDKVFFLSPGPSLQNHEGRLLVRALNRQLSRDQLTKNLSGYTLSDQFFVPGYVLFDQTYNKSLGQANVPEKFRKTPIEILGIDSRITEPLRSNLIDAITSVTGVQPNLTLIKAGEMNKVRSAGHFDLWAGTLPVNDENVEGALGYIFGFSPPFIPNGEGTSGDFQARFSNAKQLANQAARNVEYRRIFAEAIDTGCILPFFHFSTTAIAKSGLDLKMVPTTDETVTFSKVRFK
jgi:MarR-like DNA-binding transcriptional regulator SgrR of sgrS sRNA